VFQYLGWPAPVTIVILYCFSFYCMALCAKFINKIKTIQPARKATQLLSCQEDFRTERT